jgi:Calcineurin-like phosphoesterase
LFQRDTQSSSARVTAGCSVVRTGGDDRGFVEAGRGALADPRAGDVEDDASSTKRRSLVSLAGSLLAEISLPKLALAWMLLLVVPALMLGMAPVVASAWIREVSGRLKSPLDGRWPLLILVVLAALGWFGGKALFRLAEKGFWSLNSLAVQPGYLACREILSHLAENMLPSRVANAQLAKLRSVTATIAGLVVCGLAVLVIALVWPSTRWIADFSEFTSLHWLTHVAFANSLTLIAAYLAAAALVWGIADATLPQPRDLDRFGSEAKEGCVWRIAHLSDIHVVGERYGFRIESGRSGPQGNERLRQAIGQLAALREGNQLDLVLITGDVTDAGRSAEWAEFLDAVALHPRLAERILVLPGNHDLNVVDRANPARLETPTSPKKRLRIVRTLSAMSALQGGRVRVVDQTKGGLGVTLAEAIEPYLAEIVRFADAGRPRFSSKLTDLWAKIFPMVLPPDRSDGLGVILLNSNADTHFSFTNAFGMISTEQVRGLKMAVAEYPRACWIIALHHHVTEYPRTGKALSERIGTALINGNWFLRQLRALEGRVVVMHGHRHIDWIGDCAGLLIVSAPSPVMEVTNDLATYFYIQTLITGADGRLRLLPPQRIALDGAPALSNSAISTRGQCS